MEGMFPEPHFVETNGIRMAVFEEGQGDPVIFLHGFPELAFSWRFQLPALAEAGYRPIAIDQRGYGQTTVPPNVADYRIDELIGDIIGLLDNLELERSIFVGHDWGAFVLWHMSLLCPERMEKQAILNIPFWPRPPIDPIDLFRQRFGDDFYIVNFQDSDEADRAFASDPAHFFDVLMRKNQVSRKDFDRLPPGRRVLSLLKVFAREESSGDPILNNEELAYFAAAFAGTGFTGPINWYRNWSANWKRLDGVPQIIDVPTLFIGATDDIVVSPEHIAGMKPYVTNLETHVLENCGHWSQQERPEDVNRILIDWLNA
ncbi:MAG: alpha/beta fold hydrolase [Woeseiaceae bacterium]|nr:alpha/beta fold hydrolase [Woeseiaceae bacterium]